MTSLLRHVNACLSELPGGNFSSGAEMAGVRVLTVTALKVVFLGVGWIRLLGG